MNKKSSEQVLMIQKKSNQILKNNKKIAKTRRQRGYTWEGTIVKRFNKIDGWKAFRLGSPSVSLPDILVVNSKKSSIFAIEAKSGTVSALLVPVDQIERCRQWTETFKIYKDRKIILAFKFLAKKRIGLGQYESRKLKEYFKIWNTKYKVSDCVCTYEGEIFIHINGKRQKINLNSCKIPFKTRSK